MSQMLERKPVQAGADVWIEGSPRRVRAYFGGVAVADSKRAVLLYERGHLPTYYFPIEDVRQDLLTATDHHTHCPRKGDASYWSSTVGERTAENAVWGYSHDPGTNIVEVYVRYLRRKLDQPGRPTPIETVRSVGYRLADAV